ncbi:hypothetical protein KDW_23520 [Dictyobacter vulcani]|uniref:Uncharacterized protein n=1 Tax=Dictyobacter vulcani TaxID=2607529 RepID=A0A5J4KP55_9CHLR|nr:hypothetical protein [Dictyobacter vulcani]GER88190.1 hypothetical protein KDW_23520 [Dictyobacter vulcani]
MLHKGRLQAALNAKKGQFSLFDGSFNEQLAMYQYALESLYERYTSSAQLENMLPPDDVGMPSAGARPTMELDRWLVNAANQTYHGPVFPFGREFTSHEQSRLWAECIEGTTTIAVDGSQLMPWRDASIPVGLVQVGFFVNPHARGRTYTKDVRMEVLAPEELMEETNNDSDDPDSYPYSEMQVTQRRYLLEIETLCTLMQQHATARREEDPVYKSCSFL